ncbi:hypothetical protein MSNKSG1_16731 [Marinobacter santoriniensis NKSG1]|uniref:Uncharacterized protein n=1 Tax=Marinobacter santoriniensis NKSG1 TaxID=1288826 RepID=M7D0F3_9GAMM|nr:hypothetical protein [Marinobacter santoriniensis]EMP54243.1 hypothetical protein MSNKSG1_16731 [Marinobacter santoriniensis NKSG1]
MCRIDAPYRNRSLDEKRDPLERFTQALDEFEIHGHIRSLLTKHFSDIWHRIFGSASNLEDVLSSARQETSDHNKCAAILSSRRLADELALHIHDQYSTVTRPRAAADHGSEVLAFAQELIQTYFSESPYTLYSALKNMGAPTSLTLSYDWFVTGLYGEAFCLSRSLFDDPALLAEEEITRNDILWGFFNRMSGRDDGNGNKLNEICVPPQLKNLFSASSLAFQAGPHTLGAKGFLKSIGFLKAWTAFDAEAGRIRSAEEGVFRKIDFEWSDLFAQISSIGSSNIAIKEASDAAYRWLGKAKIELQEAYSLHADIGSFSETEIEQWALQLNRCFKLHSYGHPTDVSQDPAERDAAEKRHLELICSQLTDDQVRAWIRWSIRQDISSALGQTERQFIFREFYGAESGKWWGSEYSSTWRAILEEELDRLEIEDQLGVLSGKLHALPSEAADREYRAWWNSLLERLIKDPDFPVALTPQWTVAALNRLDDELITPYISKSIGLLRGELSQGGKEEHHKQLEELLRRLSFIDPSKAARHRLLLMRSSATPIADESIARLSSLHSEKAVEWYLPFNEVARDRFANTMHFRSHVSLTESEQIELECYESFALELVEFCLSRLRLRKGEKPKDGRYDTTQVTEQSPIWRQGYLKALLELGIDPNGKAHKTAYFTKQFDPDESVQAVAKECYRAVRREAKKNRSIQDVRRGLIAAEWWLLMSQRLELNLAVDHERALKTRRNLLRNPI